MSKLIGLMNVYNEADYVRYAIKSTIDYLDKLYIFEGAFKETYNANNLENTLFKNISNDGTLTILMDLAREYPEKIHLTVLKSVLPQIQQRSLIFNYIKDCWLLIIDGDEIWNKENIEKIKYLTLEEQPFECLGVESLVFVNDFKNYVPMELNRLFRIRPEYTYRFTLPNTLLRWSKGNPYGSPLHTIQNNNIKFFHPSYVKTKERFLQKRKERVAQTGSFRWEWDDTKGVINPGANIKEFNGELPEVLRNHKYVAKNSP